MDPRNISITDYSYHLPEEKIAYHPLADRDASKLLLYRRGKISEHHYSELADFLPEQSLLVFNNSKVIEARIIFQKHTGGAIEIFCLEPHESLGDVSSALHQKEKVLWKCLIGGASKWKKGLVLEKKIKSGASDFSLQAQLVEKKSDYFVIQFSWSGPGFDFAEVLHLSGAIPLPPYIKRKAEAEDSERYQTIFADGAGSVAAPTAGLHFTNAIFEKLAAKNIQTEFLTLHVGAGTFKPVKSDIMARHEMHPEFIEVSESNLLRLIESPAQIIAVGTTSLRTLETLFWMGAKIISNLSMDPDEVAVHQWDAYEIPANNISARESLEALLSWMRRLQLKKIITKTKLLIAPGYRFRIVKGLVTNFHQPQSTLLLLVAALIGDDWKKVYDYALANDFRFLSYGDGCLLFKN